MIPAQVTLVRRGATRRIAERSAAGEHGPQAGAHPARCRRQACARSRSPASSAPSGYRRVADNSAVMAGLQRAPGVRYSVARAQHEGARSRVAVSSRRDRGVRRRERGIQPAATSTVRSRSRSSAFRPVVQAAKAQGVHVRAAVSCALGCPYQGEESADEVERVVRLMKDIGVEHCGIADTIGTGTPRRAQQALERALRHFPLDAVSGHFHDTYGQALANIYACLELGVHVFDTSAAGLGGVPLCQRCHRQRGHRRRGLHAAGPWASIPASTSTGWSMPGPTSPTCSAGRRCHARARLC